MGQAERRLKKYLGAKATQVAAITIKRSVQYWYIQNSN